MMRFDFHLSRTDGLGVPARPTEPTLPCIPAVPRTEWRSVSHVAVARPRLV